VGVGVGVDGVGTKLPFIHSITSTIPAMISTRLSETDHPMHTILDCFFRFRSSHVSLKERIGQSIELLSGGRGGRNRGESGSRMDVRML
jgi:hypothetical protein